MTRYANLTSVDAVRLLAAALRSFEEDAGGALADLQMQINRVLSGSTTTAKSIGPSGSAAGYQEVAEAKQNLERRLIYRATDERPFVPRGESGPGKGQTPPGCRPGKGPGRSALGPQHRTRDPRVPREHQSAGRLGADRSAPGLRAFAADEPGPGRLCQPGLARGGPAVDWMAMIAEASACVAGTAADGDAERGDGRRGGED